MNVRVPGSTPTAHGSDIQIAQATDEPIGKVETVEGTVIAKHADGSEAPLHGGDPVFQGDELRTGPEGAVGIVFIDNSTFSLAEDARMTLDELVYDPAGQQGVLKASLVQGVFSFISGEIAKTDPDAMTITTPMATIGIRGTTGAINLPPDAPLTVVLTADAGGTVGEISVFNAAGVQVLSVPFQATQVAGAGAAPSVTFTMTAEEFNSSFGRALSFLPASPAAGDGEDDGEGEGDGEDEGDGGETGEGDGDGEDEGEDGEGDGDGDGETGEDGGEGDLEGAEEFADAFAQTLQDFIGSVGDDFLAGGTGPDQSDIDALTEQIEDLFEQYPVLSPYNPFPEDPDDPDDPVLLGEGEFEETLYGTSGDDTLSGNDLDTDFRMEQDGTSLPSGTLGGTDTVDGGAGTDQITFDNLNQVIGYFDAANSELQFWDWSQYGDSNPDDPSFVHAEETEAQANVNFVGMEQLYFGSYDGSADAQFGIDFSFGGNFTGMMVAGGSGDDSINWSNGTQEWFSGADAVLIFGGGGNDTIYGSSVFDDIQGGDGNDTIYVAGGYNTANSIAGGAGDDTIHVHSFDALNTITGGAGTDTVDYSYLESNLTVSLSQSFVGVLHGAAQGDTISGVETLIGSSIDDVFSFTGTASGSGVTTVNGDDGNDTFSFGTGATFGGLVDGGAGTDTLVLGASANTVTVANVETITGGALEDTITIQSGSNVVVTGGTYSDTLTLDGSSHVVRYTSLGDLGDIINGYAKASDALLFDSSVFLGDGGDIFGGSNNTLSNLEYFHSGSGMVASDGASVFFFQDTDTGKLYYDADGSDGASAAVLVADFDSDLEVSDFIGTSGAVA